MVAVTLGVAVLLTVYTLIAYAYRYRNLFQSGSAVHPASGDGS